MFCPSKTKGAYVFHSLPYRRKEITLMEARSGEHGQEYYDKIARNRLADATSRCAEMRRRLAKHRAASARKTGMGGGGKGAGDVAGSKLIGPGSIAFNRSSEQVQTGLYLEELTEEIEKDDFGTQTDAFLDRPPTPMFVPAKTGIDVETQIYQDDLFDFNLEVQPMLEVLVGKTMEQSLLEVMEEEELADLRRQQEVLKEIHNADLSEIARLEDRNRRYLEEKARRLAEYERASALAKETAEKISAKVFTKAYLGPLVKSTIQQLIERGYLYDHVEDEIQEYFMEPLFDGVIESMSREREARILVDGLIREAVAQRHHAYRELARRLYEEKLANIVLPQVSKETAYWIIEKGLRLIVVRMEAVAGARKHFMKDVIDMIYKEALEEIALEVQAQKEAEEAAENAENSDDEF